LLKQVNKQFQNSKFIFCVIERQNNFFKKV
jgi:hypothetical protein